VQIRQEVVIFPSWRSGLTGRRVDRYVQTETTAWQSPAAISQNAQLEENVRLGLVALYWAGGGWTSRWRGAWGVVRAWAWCKMAGGWGKTKGLEMEGRPWLGAEIEGGWGSWARWEGRRRDPVLGSMGGGRGWAVGDDGSKPLALQADFRVS
jgi:hypothetical protein